jgi:hypothetical protein
MAQTSPPIPTPLLYSLFKAVNPPPASEVSFKAPKGRRLDTAGKRALQEALDAARRARSPRQFATLLGGEAHQQAAISHGSITTLTVTYGKDGYTKVEIIYQDGTHILSAFPTAT